MRNTSLQEMGQRRELKIKPKYRSQKKIFFKTHAWHSILKSSKISLTTFSRVFLLQTDQQFAYNSLVFNKSSRNDGIISKKY